MTKKTKTKRPSKRMALLSAKRHLEELVNCAMAMWTYDAEIIKDGLDDIEALARYSITSATRLLTACSLLRG